MMKNALADAVGVATRMISAYEAGENEPSPSTIESLVKTLRVPREFFYAHDIDEPLPQAASFRSYARMSAAQRDAALAAGALAMDFSTWIDERFTLPRPDVPDLRSYEPEAAANALRERWELGERRVPNLVHLLESKGVRVFSLVERAKEVDAFSLWRVNTPFIFLNTMKTAEHGRFDAAHELGHLVLHKHGGPRGREAEHEANLFASAFLMPRASVLSLAPKMVTLRTLIASKLHWSVSVAALSYRLHQIGLVSDWHYRTLCIQINEAGYRKAEPNGIARETSQVLAKIFDALQREGTSRSEIARAVNLHREDLDALVFGLVLTPILGGGDTSKPRGTLRVVPRDDE